MPEHACTRRLRRIHAPPRVYTKRTVQQAATAIVTALSGGTRKLRSRPQASRVCRAPPSFDTGLLRSLRSRSLQVTRHGGRPGRTRLLWTDWMHGLQSVACSLADAMNRDGGAYAIEQTAMVNDFLRLCGQWDDEAVHFKSYMRGATDAHVEQLRKDVWDGFSVAFASATNMPNTVICVPIGDGVAVDPSKTLFKLELPALVTDRYCVVGYDMQRNAIVVNPHLGSASPPIPLRGAVTLPLVFHPWNTRAKQLIVRTL